MFAMYLWNEYDNIYREADILLKKYNPCQIKNSSCVHSIVYGYDKKLCCTDCKYWKDGCTVKALDCKLWTCPSIENKELINKLSLLRLRARNLGIPFGYRQSKEDVFFRRFFFYG